MRRRRNSGEFGDRLLGEQLMRLSPEPLEATVLPDLPAKRARGGARGWILACLAFLLFVAGFAALLWGLGQLLARAGGARPSRSGSLLERWETTDERLAAVHS